MILQYEPMLAKSDEAMRVFSYMSSDGWYTEFEKTREFEKIIINKSSSFLRIHT